jgi:choline kinase
MSPPRALILAAGTGTRLMPLTADCPKVLVEVAVGKCLLGGLFDACISAGIRDVVVVTGYLAEGVDRFVADQRGGLSISTVFNSEFAALGNAWSVYAARDALAGADFVKMDGDVVLDPAILRGVITSPHASAIALDRRADIDEEAMKAVVGQDGGVTALGKWVALGDASGESIGVEKIAAAAAPAFFEAIERVVRQEGVGDAYYEDVYHRMLGDGFKLGAYDIGDKVWGEVDDQRDLLRARELMALIES